MEAHLPYRTKTGFASRSIARPVDAKTAAVWIVGQCAAGCMVYSCTTIIIAQKQPTRPCSEQLLLPSSTLAVCQRCSADHIVLHQLHKYTIWGAVGWVTRCVSEYQPESRAIRLFRQPFDLSQASSFPMCPFKLFPSSSSFFFFLFLFLFLFLLLLPLPFFFISFFVHFQDAFPALRAARSSASWAKRCFSFSFHARFSFAICALVHFPLLEIKSCDSSACKLKMKKNNEKKCVYRSFSMTAVVERVCSRGMNATCMLTPGARWGGTGGEHASSGIRRQLWWQWTTYPYRNV